MSKLIQVIILSTAIGLAKSAGFVRVVVLAGLGLAGLWMLHTLAQDFNSIMLQGFGSGGSGRDLGTGKLFNNNNNNGNEQEIKVYKRSINTNNHHKTHQPNIDWDLVIKRDPASCARSFICQLAASKSTDLVFEEQMILNLTKIAANDETWAGKQLEEALTNGQTLIYPHQCMKMYKYCPYSKRTMMALLRVFGNR